VFCPVHSVHPEAEKAMFALLAGCSEGEAELLEGTFCAHAWVPLLPDSV